MAVVLPFRAIRPDIKYAGEVAALPYDVYSRKEAREAVKGKPLSFLNIDRPETQFPERQDMYAPEVYGRAREMLHREMAEGIFVREPAPCYYLYELSMDGRTQTGVVALSAIDDYLKGICRKHENTVEEKEQDRIRHVDICSMQTGPIFLCYREQAALRQLIAAEKEAAPLYAFQTEDGIGHRAWRIADEGRVAAFQEAFSHVPYTYIADGHHRAASAVKVGLRRRSQYPLDRGEGEFNYFLSVLFPDEELCILSYNRVVKDLNGFQAAGFLERLSTVFDVEPLEGVSLPERKGIFSMYLSGKWYRLSAREEVLSKRAADPVGRLDVSLLQEEVLSPLLSIGDPRTDKRIEFVGGIHPPKVLSEKVDAYDRQQAEAGTLPEKGPAVAFWLYPTGIEELLSVADAGLLMPPKSTWFEPKLRSGLFLHAIEEPSAS